MAQTDLKCDLIIRIVLFVFFITLFPMVKATEVIKCKDNEMGFERNDSIILTGYLLDMDESCMPYTLEPISESSPTDPWENGALEIAFNDGTLIFSIMNFRDNCGMIIPNPKAIILGDTLNVYFNIDSLDFNMNCTCERSYIFAFDNVNQGHYAINLHYNDNSSVVGLYNINLNNNFKCMVFDNRKSLPDNCRLNENYIKSKCLANMGYRPGDPHDEELPQDEELGSVRLSYRQEILSVDLRGWYYYCGHNMMPLAIINGNAIEIYLECTFSTDCLCYQNISFDFSGIKSGKYRIRFMNDDFRGSGNRAFEVDLQDGYSQLFLKGANDLANVNNYDDESIKFDGTLVEFSSDGSATLELFTTEGVRLERTEGSGTVRLSTGELMPGIYVVRATAADGRTARRKIAVK